MNLKLYIFIVCLVVLGSLSLEFDVFHLYEKRLKKLEKPVSQKQDKSFTLVIPTYNCVEIIEKTFQSILSQTYKNYRVIFIDDHSDDHTCEKLEELIQYNSVTDSFILRKNSFTKGVVESLYETVHQCEDHEIIVFFEANSWLANEQVLENLNHLYKNYEIWLAYGEFVNYRTKEKGGCRAINSQNLFHSSMKRTYWVAPKLKTFYAGLFKKVPLEDFFFRGKFVSEKFDKAYMFPMMEMAQKHVGFLKDIQLFYIQNKYREEARPCNKALQKCNKQLLLQPTYPLLKTPPYLVENKEEKKADLIVFSYNRPIQLYAFLESVQKHVQGYEKIFIIYRHSEDKFKNAYQQVQKDFPHAHFLNQEQVKHFQPLVHEAIFTLSNADYILFSVDDIIVKDKINIHHAIRMMELTKAYFFSFRLGYHINYCYMGGYPQKMPNHVCLQGDVIGWQIDSARGDWTYPHSLDMTIYRKNHLKQIFPHITYRFPNELEPVWEKYVRRHFKAYAKKFIGLSYTLSKAVNIPLNIVFPSNNNNINLFTIDELLKLFEEGFKIDIQSLYKIENPSVHIDYEPIFIKRNFN